jgi:predicted ribosomally synthesized peptide with SipW-like signal peptide
MRKVIYSAGMILFVGAMTLGGTGAFFSDTEKSTGNVLAAGAIDLKIDNESYVTSTTTGELVLSTETSWEIRDLTIEKFFDFEDLKPGDIGEDTISLHVDNNDSWLCADVTLTSDDENTLVDPEVDDGDVTAGPIGGGELADQVNFVWWADDGDNVFEDDENLLPGGPIGALVVGATTTVTLADSSSNIWGDQGPIPGASTRYIGKAWCFGDMLPDPVIQDGEGKTGDNGPLERGTGFTCDGSLADNTAQTDSLTADVAFRAVQSRNNSQFLCTPSTEPVVTTLTLAKTVIPAEFVADSAFILTASSTDTLISGVEGPGVTNVVITPGEYTLTESEAGPGGEVLTWSCSGNATPEVLNVVTIALGESVTCEAINTYPELTL